MIKENYVLPLSFSQLIQKNTRMERCNLDTSIRQHIYLLLTCRFRDWRYDEEYGCVLWQYDFDTNATFRTKRQEIERSVKLELEKYETRLADLRVNFKIVQEELLVRGFKSLKRAKERLEIHITGRILETNQQFNPAPFIIYFSPIIAGTND